MFCKMPILPKSIATQVFEEITCSEQVTSTLSRVFFFHYDVLHNQGYDIHPASSD